MRGDPYDAWLDDELSRLLSGYGYNGRSTSGWAYLDKLEHALRLAFLRAEARKRADSERPSNAAVEASDPGDRLYRLRLERWLRWHYADQRRQRRVCEALGLPWPPESRERPWRWCWEVWPDWKLEEPSPVVYPADWARDELEPDLYGCGESWRPGEPLIVPYDEVPVDGVIVRDRTTRGHRVRPRITVEPDEPVALPGLPALPPAEEPEPEERSRRLPARWREVGTWDAIDGFRPPRQGLMP